MKETVQEQLIAIRRNQILDAAANVFAGKGFKVTTIKDIAKEAGVAEGTIYNYFDNKSALLLGIFERMKNAVQQSVDFSQVTEMDIRSFWKFVLLSPLNALKADNFALFRVVMSEAMVNPELNALYYHNILEPTLAMAETHFGQWATAHGIPQNRMRLIVRVVASTVLGLIVQHIMGDKTLDAQWDELPDTLVDLFVNGVEGKQS